MGGGFAGLYSALALAKINLLEQWQIVIIDKTDRFEFSPLLYELISGELEPWEIAPPYLQLLRNERISFYCDRVEDINLDARQVQLRDRGSLSYTYLIIALGLERRVPPHPDVLSFRRLADVERLNAELERLQHQPSLDISIIGAGASGVELACKLADRLGDRHQIHLIHRGSQLLPKFSPQTRKAAQRAINKRRIRLSLNTNVKGIQHQGDFQLQLQQQEKFFKETSHLVIWTAGTQVNPLIRRLPGGEQGQLPVTPELQLTRYPEVFVLGDLAATPPRQQRPSRLSAGPPPGQKPQILCFSRSPETLSIPPSRRNAHPRHPSRRCPQLWDYPKWTIGSPNPNSRVYPTTPHPQTKPKCLLSSTKTSD